ncbi:MAG: ATP-binding protein [Armatimonadota bacterium]|nr:ATP-binding protein [Armatimonadota bacterium]MDR5702019.1 ATP-binding protein [Armatimonadota bacterium]MDR7434683.1 ATP-binding protein [Armatimonadota bacterium]
MEAHAREDRSTLQDLFLRLLRDRGRHREEEIPEGGPEVRLAIYDSPQATPQVISLSSSDFHELVGELASKTYNYSRERGGRIPYVVIREIIENLIHAYFQDAVITILEDGNTIRISDRGPGIKDKEKAFLPGFTTATREMKRFIRGVGSGLPVAREQLSFLGGTITIEDNLEHGTVVTLQMEKRLPHGRIAPGLPASPPPHTHRLPLTPRQKKILLLIAELGSVGPTTLSKELGISHSTAYRELQILESLQLVTTKGGGKRTLTEEGIAYLDEVFKP